MSNAYLLLRNVNIIWLTTMWWISNPFTRLADVLLQWKLGWYGSVVIVKSVIVVVVLYIRCGNVHFELQTSWINIKIIRKQWRIWFNVGAQCLQRVLERGKENPKNSTHFLSTHRILQTWTQRMDSKTGQLRTSNKTWISSLIETTCSGPPLWFKLDCICSSDSWNLRMSTKENQID